MLWFDMTHVNRSRYFIWQLLLILLLRLMRPERWKFKFLFADVQRMKFFASLEDECVFSSVFETGSKVHDRIRRRITFSVLQYIRRTATWVGKCLFENESSTEPAAPRAAFLVFFVYWDYEFFISSISDARLCACAARSCTALDASSIVCAICPAISLTLSMDLLISSLAADCSSLAVAMALT